MYLLQYCDNYADEFDIYGFTILTYDEVNAYFSAIANAEYPVIHYFGTNEFIEYDSKEQVFDRLSSKFITDVEYRLINNLFSCHCDALFPDIETFLSQE